MLHSTQEQLHNTQQEILSGSLAGPPAATNKGRPGARERGLLSLSLIFITRVAPHCVNTLMILHAAHTLMMSAG
jgi:hypothetical protein